MESFSPFWQNIIMTIVGVLFSVVAYFLIDFKNNIQKIVDGFKSELSKIKDDIGGDFKEMGSKIDDHKDAMGKCTKAINGDMLEIRKSVSSLKEGVADDLIKMKNEVGKLQINAAKLVGELKIATTQFNDKFGRILELQNSINETHGKVVVLERELNGVGTKVEIHGKAHHSTKEILKKYRQEINLLSSKYNSFVKGRTTGGENE